MTREYEILTEINDRLSDISNLKYVGYYPDDYKTVASFINLPSALIFNGDGSTQFRSGRRNYNRVYISVFLYTDFSISRVEQVLSIQDEVILAVISDIQYGTLVSNIWGYTVQVGDITDLISPSTTGMNGNMTVRKITFDFEYYTSGVS